MDNFYLSALLDEIRPTLVGQKLNRISLANSSLLLDFRLPDDRLLRASFDRSAPALYLDKPFKEPQNEAHPFLSSLKKELVGARLTAITKPLLDRIVCLDFATSGQAEPETSLSLVFSFTGRTANAYLLDVNRYVEVSFNTRGSNILRVGDAFDFEKTNDDIEQLVKGLTDNSSQEEILELFFRGKNLFSPLLEKEFIERCQTATPTEAIGSLLADVLAKRPIPLVYSRVPLQEFGQKKTAGKTELWLSHFPLAIARGLEENRFHSLSEAASRYDQARNRALRLQNRYNELKKLLGDEIKKRAKRLEAIQGDKAKFKNPERFKELGDLLLANYSTARRQGTKAFVIDYYDPSQPEIEIEIGERKTLQQSSNDYFTRYQKARRALETIAELESTLKPTLASLQDLALGLDKDLSAVELDELKAKTDTLLGIKPKDQAKPSGAKKGAIKKSPGRRYLTPTGFEVVVGKNDKENDAITFRLANSLDIWMHAADYPGSHVIIRNPNRQEIPLKAIQEAAELAAFFSQAREQNKVAVHYTQKKFVSKPPRAQPGLVRLSSFKTILVEPRAILKKIDS